MNYRWMLPAAAAVGFAVLMSMAKDGARMALVAYDKHEEAIRKAEALVQK